MKNNCRDYFPILLIFNFTFIFYYFEDIKLILKIGTEKSFLTKFKPNQEYNYKTFGSNEWIFNFNVSQYSSILVGDINKDTYIESLVFFDLLKSHRRFKNDIKCLIYSNDNFELIEVESLLKIDLLRAASFYKSLWKVKCKIDSRLHQNNLLDIRVAIIDTDFFDYYMKKFDNKAFTLQIPMFFNSSLPKKKQVVNCVHMVRIDDSKFDKIKNWLDIQREIGYYKIKFYFLKVDKKYLDFFEKNNNNFIEFVDYPTDFEKICEWHIKQFDSNSESELNQFFLVNCEKANELHIKISSDLIFNSHERMHTNDCFMKFKHEYEFVTNYDLDEIIFPRLYPTNSYDHLIDQTTKCEDIKLLNNTQLNKYNIYDYTKGLFDKYGENIANLHFYNVVFFIDHFNFDREILQLTGQSGEIFKYTNKYGYVNYNIKSKHLNLINSFKKLIPIVNCLNYTYMNQSKFDYKWNNLFASKMIMREGKSIFKTEYAQSLNQHFANNYLPGTKRYNVPLSDGFVSHFRDDLLGFINKQSYAFDFLRLDFEYYLFFLSIANKK